jgi:hypothetical protein
MLSLHLLTFHTLNDVINNILLHFRPKELASYYCNCFLVTRMSNIRNTMHFLQYQIPQFSRTRNIDSIFMHEESIFLYVILLYFLLYISLL